MTIKKSIAECAEAVEMFAKEHGYKAYVPEGGLYIPCVKNSEASEIFLNTYVFTLATDFYYDLDEDETRECKGSLANLFTEMIQDKLGATCFFKFGNVMHHEVHILF